MKKDDAVYLNHILDAINQIETYVEGLSYQQFLKNRLIQDGVIRQLEIIGEASRNFSDTFRNQYTQVPWSQIIGLRNHLIHAYFDVSLSIVWDVIQNDLPSLKNNLT